MKYLQNIYTFIKYEKKATDITINEDIVLHFAGIAHDLNNKFTPKNYYEVNTNLTKNIFDSFLNSRADTFIFLSSIKAVVDTYNGIITEETIANPTTHYGISKLMAEEYILSQEIPHNKRVYILRPCMIHGIGNKGNMNLLYKYIKIGFPWIFNKFENQKSFCSIQNLIFILNELINNHNIPPGIYNISDTDSISTNDLVYLISSSIPKKLTIFTLPKNIILLIARFGDYFNLIFNTKTLNKLTDSYIVSNKKIINAIKKDLPITTKQGILITLNSFN
jgi:nucleoside-diphosphate-sugar epimerase